MDVKTYRARSMQEALALVERDLGPDAAVLHTRQLNGPLRWLLGARRIEVTASTSVAVPSRLASLDAGVDDFSHDDSPCYEASIQHPPSTIHHPASNGLDGAGRWPPAIGHIDYRAKFRDDIKSQIDNLNSMVEDLCRWPATGSSHEMPESLFHLFTDLIDAEVSEDLARELIDRVRQSGIDHSDVQLVKSRIARMIEDEIQTSGPLQIVPGQRRIVALVGPTGVGKTTTIAKLAANFRLREKRRVGLITVDTYRIAAVEQLRTYADIIDLPMEVVATPREMRQAVARLSDLDLVLIDTAGRSHRDEVKIQELKSMLAEAQADEVQLVLSSASAGNSLVKIAEKFAEVGTSSILLTKLDEATGLGNLLPLVRTCRLPLSYVTDGQNVPDDIQPADSRKLARLVLGME